MAYLVSILCVLCWTLAFAATWGVSETLGNVGYSPFLFIGGAIALPVYLLKEKHPNKYVYWFNLLMSSALVLIPLGIISLLLPIVILVFTGSRVHV